MESLPFDLAFGHVHLDLNDISPRSAQPLNNSAGTAHVVVDCEIGKGRRFPRPELL